MRDEIGHLAIPKKAKAYARRHGLDSMKRQPQEYIDVMADVLNQKKWQHNFKSHESLAQEIVDALLEAGNPFPEYPGHRNDPFSDVPSPVEPRWPKWKEQFRRFYRGSPQPPAPERPHDKPTNQAVIDKWLVKHRPSDPFSDAPKPVSKPARVRKSRQPKPSPERAQPLELVPRSHRARERDPFDEPLPAPPERPKTLKLVPRSHKPHEPEPSPEPEPERSWHGPSQQDFVDDLRPTQQMARRIVDNLLGG